MKKLKNLDSLRTIAFLTTFSAHNFESEIPAVKSTWVYQAIDQLKNIFDFGVPLFFVLSGFLITYLMLAEEEIRGKFSIKNFYIRRVLRIWPLYYLVLLFGFVIFPLIRDLFIGGAYHETANPLMYLLFLGNFDQLMQGTLPSGSGLGVTWSVAVEEQFYVVWPLLFLAFRKKHFLKAIVATLVISFIVSFALGLSGKHTLLCTVYLSAGAMLGYVHRIFPVVSARLTKISGIAFAGIVAATIGFMQFSERLGNFIPGHVLVLVLALLMAYIILYQIQCPPNMDIKRVPGLEFWGKYTYGLYLYHTICNFFAITAVRLLGIYGMIGGTATDLIFRPLLSMLLALIISYLSFHYFEKFFLRMKNRFGSLVHAPA